MAPNSRVEVKSVWVTQAGSAGNGSQDVELGSLTGSIAGPIRTFQVAAADSSSASPGGMCLHYASMYLTSLATHLTVYIVLTSHDSVVDTTVAHHSTYTAAATDLQGTAKESTCKE